MKWKRSKKNFPSSSKSDNQSDASMNPDEACLEIQSDAELANMDDDSDIDVSDDPEIDFKHNTEMLDASVHDLKNNSDDLHVTQMDISVRNFNVQESMASMCNHMSNFSVENKLLSPSSIS